MSPSKLLIWTFSMICLSRDSLKMPVTVIEYWTSSLPWWWCRECNHNQGIWDVVFPSQTHFSLFPPYTGQLKKLFILLLLFCWYTCLHSSQLSEYVQPGLQQFTPCLPYRGNSFLGHTFPHTRDLASSLGYQVYPGCFSLFWLVSAWLAGCQGCVVQILEHDDQHFETNFSPSYVSAPAFCLPPKI